MQFSKKEKLQDPSRYEGLEEREYTTLLGLGVFHGTDYVIAYSLGTLIAMITSERDIEEMKAVVNAYERYVRLRRGVVT